MEKIGYNIARGLFCEERVVEYFLALGFLLVGRRVRTPFAEIDILFRDLKGRLVLVEVKSVLSFDYLPARMGPRQKRRLLRALEYFLARGELARLEFAVVSQEGAVLCVPDVFSS